MDTITSAAASLRNSVLYPAGRFVRNTAAPAIASSASTLRNSALYPAGRFVRNTAAPAIASSATTLRNSALYPAGRFVRNTAAPAAYNAITATGRTMRNRVIKPCVGRLCTMRANRATRRAAARGAMLFTAGLRITNEDKTVLDGILELPTPTAITGRKEQLADQLSQEVSDYMVDRNIEPDMNTFKELSRSDRFSAMIKGVYMIHYGSMGRKDELPDTIPAYTAANILAQAFYVSSNNIEYNNDVNSNATLQERINRYIANHSNNEHFDNGAARPHTNGGKRKSRKNMTRRRR